LRAKLRVLATTGTTIAILSAAADAQIAGLVARDLAGNATALFPHFQHVRAFNEGSQVRFAIDPGTNPGLIGKTVNLYVCNSKNIAGWTSSPGLVDVSGGAETVLITNTNIQSNTFVVDNGTLSGNAGIELGVPYDLIMDVNQDGILNAGDYIDGYSDTAAGFYVCADTTQPGPLLVVEQTYDLSGAAWDEQNTFYPITIGSMGKLPLVVISHGNGHNYQWYDHMGTHLASHGYVVMSHSNNTGPGVEQAATTTLSNVTAFLGNLGTIAGGALNNHVDADRIVWIGHSRGGEGVVIAYDRLFTGAASSPFYQIGDIKLVSSIAPVDFQTYPHTDPHAVNYSLWTGGADADVNGCASCNLCQTFHLHDRAQQVRQSISLHGVGHGDFHNGGGSSVATGPCLVGRLDTHKIVKGYLFPLVERYIDGNVPAIDYLSRQWESFKPPGAPLSACVNVDLMYREGNAPGKIVLDDYQANPLTTKASSGLSVGYTVAGVTEGNMDDPSTVFTNSAEAFNGFTVDGDGADNSRGVVFEWNGGNTYYAWFVPGGAPLGLWKELSFRACQSTRDNLTTPVLADLTFDVTVVDTSLNFARINIAAFGGGIEEPYQRTSCGTGAGWANEFETIRIPIESFRNNNTGINLNSILAVGFEFGPSHGSTQGRIGVDDVELYFN
jgi:hypothetical protein